MAAPLVPGMPFNIRSMLVGHGSPAGVHELPRGQSAETTDTHGSVHAQRPSPSLTDFHAVLVMAPGAERDAMAMGLWDAGMLVTTFKSPHEAEGVLVGEAVHVVLLDAELGVAMAPQIVWWLHAVGRGAVKVVVFGRVSESQHAELIRHGVAFVVPKPENTAAFARQLGAAMGFTPRGWR